MTGERVTREGFDPRVHSCVALAVGEHLSNRSGRSEPVPVKSYIIGPNVAPPSLSLRRPASAGLPRRLPNGAVDPTPKFLGKTGKWLQDEVPSLIAESQAQSLTATTTLTATLPGNATRPSRAIRPVTAVYSYADISPLVQADMVQDVDMDQSLVKESTLAHPVTALATTRDKSSSHPLAPSINLANTSTLDMYKTLGAGQRKPDARRASIDAFQARQAGASFNLKIQDLERIPRLGKHIAPGGPNCRLIGSRWCYVERPTDGDVVYTDYYGRCGSKHDDYYGRAYNANYCQFSSSKMVGDSAYIKEQASMPGINQLRTRPGLCMESTIVSGAPARLDGLTIQQAQSARGLHRQSQYSRMEPAGVEAVRAGWVSH